MKKNYKIGIVGATGAVGQEFIGLLRGRRFPCAEIHPLASHRSAGKPLKFADESWTIAETKPENFEGLDLALFSAGSSVSKTLVPEAVKRGCTVIDNSSCFRMDPEVPLVVPEINPDAADGHKGIIANPNCTTAVALMGLHPLHMSFGLKRLWAATYQAVSGTGAAAMRELESQVKAWAAGEPLKTETYPHQIAFNVLPHVQEEAEAGYTKEEVKMQYESRKIMGLPNLRASTTCVRVPVFRAHSIAIFAEFERPVNLEAAREAIAGFSGAELRDDLANNAYPMPLDYSGKEKCGVGRLRVDAALDNGLAFWVSGDQLWKGAALNAVQIAELLHRKDLVRTPDR